MPKVIRALDVFLEESESRKSWSAWFSVSWSDDSISTWCVKLPANEDLNLPGLADHQWIAGILSVAAKHQVSPGDITVTMSPPNIANLSVEWTAELAEDVANAEGVIDSLLDAGFVVQPAPSPDVSREIDA